MKFYSSFNSKWTFMVFFALFELGSLICGLAVSSKMLIIGRAVTGMGSSGIYNGSFTMIAGCAPMPKRSVIIGFVIGISQLGLVMGPLIGGALTSYTTWRYCFYINLPFGGLLAILLVFSHIPEQLPKSPPSVAIHTILPKLDLIAFILFAATTIQLLLALQYGGNKFSWKSAEVIGLFCGASAMFLVFLGWEYHKGDAAMIPFFIIKKKIVWSSCLIYGFFISQLNVVSYYLPIYFQAVRGATPILSGIYIIPSVLSHVIVALSSGILGFYLPFSVVGSVLVAIANSLLSTLSIGTPTGKWIGYQIITGAGRGLALQVPIIAVQNTLSPAQIPDAMAFLFFSQAFAGALFLSVADTIFNNSLKTLIAEYTPSGSVDPQTIINAGATGFRTIVKGEELNGVLKAYTKSVNHCFHLTIGMAVSCFVFSWFIGFKDIRNKNQVSKA